MDKAGSSEFTLVLRLFGVTIGGMKRICLGFILAAFAMQAYAEHGQIYKPIPAGSKVYIDNFLTSDSIRTQLTFHPIQIQLVDNKAGADYVIEGTAREHDPSYVRTLVLSPSKMYETSIDVKDAHTGDVVMTYSRDKRKAATVAKDFAKELGRAIR